MSMNGSDPIRKTADENQRELFNRFSRAASGFAVEDAIGAALNILVNALRQGYATRNQAEARFDELLGKHKQLLMDHYDANGRRKQGLFPFNQTVRAGLVIDKDKINQH